MFCKECGHRFIAELEEEICPICNVHKGRGEKYCPFCGEPMEMGQTICHDCGLNINGEISQMGDGTIDTKLNFYHIKGRNLAVCLLLTLLSCCTYLYYWYICLAEEYGTISGEYNDSVTKDLLLITVTCGIYGIYWTYQQAEKYERALKREGRESKDIRLVACFAATIFGPFGGLLALQYYMNRF